MILLFFHWIITLMFKTIPNWAFAEIVFYFHFPSNIPTISANDGLSCGFWLKVKIGNEMGKKHLFPSWFNNIFEFAFVINWKSLSRLYKWIHSKYCFEIEISLKKKMWRWRIKKWKQTVQSHSKDSTAAEQKNTIIITN